MAVVAPARHCSFCGDSNGVDEPLFGSVGVFICIGCVHVVHEMRAGFDAIALGAEDLEPSDIELLAGLRLIVDNAEQVAEGLGSWVSLMKAHQVSWAQIGRGLGTSRQAAWERFAHWTDRKTRPRRGVPVRREAARGADTRKDPGARVDDLMDPADTLTVRPAGAL